MINIAYVSVLALSQSNIIMLSLWLCTTQSIYFTILYDLLKQFIFLFCYFYIALSVFFV